MRSELGKTSSDEHCGNMIKVLYSQYVRASLKNSEGRD